MARIDLRQLDDFTLTFLDDVVTGDIAVWNALTAKFEPQPLMSFRRHFLLMGA